MGFRLLQSSCLNGTVAARVVIITTQAQILFCFTDLGFIGLRFKGVLLALYTTSVGVEGFARPHGWTLASRQLSILEAPSPSEHASWIRC